MYTLTFVKSYQNWWDKEPKVTTITLTADSSDEVCKKYFQEYDNRNRYNNSVQLKITDPVEQKMYTEWVSDVNNYAEAGGDMW